MSTSTPYRSSARPPASTTLSSLLAQANSLNAGEHDPELPQIRLGIDEIGRMSESAAGKRKANGNRGEGATLLSSLGINTSHLSHSISHLPTDVGTSAPAAAKGRRKRVVVDGGMGVGVGMPSGSSEADMAAWGRNYHEMIILSGIEMQRQKTIKEFEAQFQQRLFQNWENEKAKILQDELGATDDEIARLTSAPGLGGSVLGKSGLGASTRRFPMAPTSSKSERGDGGMVMQAKMVRYERVVSELNQKRLDKRPIELCQAIESTVKGDSKHPLLPTAFHILAYLCQEPSLRDSSGSATGEPPVGERQYAAAYLGDSRSTAAILLRQRLIAGGRRFLERDFENHIEEIIAKNPKEAELGGVPGVRSKVKAYVAVTLRSKEAQENFKPESVDGIYIYAQAYYLLRAGYPSDALALLSEHAQSIRKDDLALIGALKTYIGDADRRLPRPARDQLFNDFNNSLRNNPNVDQFKYALYKLVGRFELNRKSAKAASTTEDWMWFQLTLVREAKEPDAPGEQYDLSDLGALVWKYGNEKFDVNGTRPFAWFNLLLFTAQFERAVAYLHGKPQLRTDAVHFGIALAYYGLLRLPSREDAELLTVEFDDLCSLNFARLIKMYIGPFFKLEPATALQYAYLVALGSDTLEGETQRRIALELVRDIVLASKGWSRLLGSVRADGTKETGLIERDLPLLHLSSSQDYLAAVVLSAADQSLADNSLIDSIELYHLAGQYDKVIESINRALGHSLSSPGSVPLRSDAHNVGLSGAFGGAQDLQTLAERVKSVYERDVAKRGQISRVNWETLEVLLLLKAAMGQFGQDRPDLALETLTQTQLLPLDADPSSIGRYATKFVGLLDQPVISNLDEVIVTTMKCLHRLSQALKQSPYGDAGRMSALQAYKAQAMCLIQFANSLRLRLGPDVYRQLSSMMAFF